MTHPFLQNLQYLTDHDSSPTQRIESELTRHLHSGQRLISLERYWRWIG